MNRLPPTGEGESLPIPERKYYIKGMRWTPMARCLAAVIYRHRTTETGKPLETFITEEELEAVAGCAINCEQDANGRPMFRITVNPR